MTEQTERIEGLDNNGIRQVTVTSGRTPLGMIEHLVHPELSGFSRSSPAWSGRGPAGGRSQ